MSESGDPVRATITAAGGVVWRQADVGAEAAIEVLLVHRPKYDDWTLPKGKHDPGETDEVCALREIEEETGLRGTIVGDIGSTTYIDHKGRTKSVRYFSVAEPVGEFSPNDEVDEVRWLGSEEAGPLLTHDRDREILDAFAAASGATDAAPVEYATTREPELAMPTAGADLATYGYVGNDPADWFSEHELARARAYQRPLARARMLRSGITAVAMAVFVFADLGPQLLEQLSITNWVAQLFVIVAALELVSLLYNPAIDAWVDLVHDKRWDISTQTRGGFVGDQFKNLILGLIMNTVLLVPLFAVIRSTDLWWVYGWLLVLVFSIGIGFLFPVVIAPIFNKFSPLDAGELSGRIQSVARLAGVEISGAYVADESRRSKRDNAYVAGLGATRRVVLFDTLLEHPPAVVEQVVAHEVGHWRLGHLRLQIPLAAALSFVVFGFLKLLSEWDWLFQQAGIPTDGAVTPIGNPAALPILLVGVQAGFMATGLVSSWVSRAFERQADLEALELLQQPQVMLDMQRRLHVKNLADLDPTRLKRLQSTHPPAAERMAFTRLWAEANRMVVEAPTADAAPLPV